MNTLLDISSANVFANFGNILDSMKSAFSEFSFIDAVDILLLSVIFFIIFKFFYNKRGGALLLGIVICVAVWFIAETLMLSGTGLIFSKIFEVGFVALVVIFQPEIRDALEKIGSGSISGIMNFGEQKKKQQIYYKAVDSICIAVGDLSRTKTGALIVLSRTTNLDDIIATGISINADTNPFLLRNLFFNKAPLHDGAVVIDDARIISAGCLLPLTRRTDIDGDLGTRHRAAVGMSEISDAIIIVVSEETGIISVAADCALTRNYTPDALRSFLLKAWVREKSDSASN